MVYGFRGKYIGALTIAYTILGFFTTYKHSVAQKPILIIKALH